MKRALLAAALAAAVAAGVATASGGPSLLNPASLNATAPATFRAKFTTTRGAFVIQVTRSWAPKGADRFYNLVANKFYDNQPIYRVVPSYVAQWGISMKPKIAKAWRNAFIQDDPPVGQKDAKGTVVFAHVLGVKNSRTSQLFVNLNNNNLGKGFPPFGVVTSGLPIFRTLYHGPGWHGQYAYNNQSAMAQSGCTSTSRSSTGSRPPASSAAANRRPAAR